MAVISINNLTKYYGSNQIFDNISFSIAKQEKIALIGRNGVGKTTLFKIISDKIDYDKGEIYCSKNTQIAYMSQKLNLNFNNTVEQEMLENFKYLKKIYDELISVTKKLNENPSFDDKYQMLLEKYERKGGYVYEREIEKVLNGLELYKFKNRKIKSLSGGEKVRVNLAKILLKKPNLMLLDEPTNHLDIVSIKWLVDYLKNYKGALIVISHDRFLLNNLVNKIIEIENKNKKIYNGNYKKFKKLKKEDKESQRRRYKKQQKKIKKLKQYIRKYKEGNRSTMAQSREKMLKRINIVNKPKEFEYDININFNNFNRLPKTVLDIDKLKIRNILKIKNLRIYRNDKIGLIGENGSGKTSILKYIVKNKNKLFDKKIDIGYFEQNIKFDIEDISLIDYLNKKYGFDKEECMDYLGFYYFSDSEAKKKINMLSGGERARFKLLNLSIKQPNFLIMDEPTNHLDLKFLEVLEESLKKFKGTLLIVTHDILFLKNIVNKLFIINNKKIIIEKYNINKKLDNLEFKSQKNNKNKTKKKISKYKYKKQKKKRNIRKKLKKEYENIENKIEEYNKKVKNIEKKMNENPHEYDKLQRLQKEKNNCNDKILSLMERWEEINEKLS